MDTLATNFADFFGIDCKEKFKSTNLVRTTYRTLIWLNKLSNPYFYYYDWLMEDVLLYVIETLRKDKFKDFGVMPNRFSMVLESKFLSMPVEVQKAL